MEKILCRVTVLTGFSNGHPLPSRLSTAERKNFAPQIAKLRALMANSLTGIDLVHCWVSWSILPLSRRTSLMHEYTGNVNDPQRHSDIPMTEEEVTESVKKMLDEPISECCKTGLAP